MSSTNEEEPEILDVPIGLAADVGSVGADSYGVMFWFMWKRLPGS